MAWSGRPGLLVITALMIAGLNAFAHAAEWTFDAAQLGGDVSADTVEMFNAGAQPPGVYRVVIYLNEEQVDEADIRFVPDGTISGTGLRPCLSAVRLAAWGIKIADDSKESSSDACFPLLAVSEAARAEFDFAGQRLRLSIPQAALEVRRPGQVPLALWDDGVPAFLLGWQGDVNRVAPREGMADEQLSRFVRLTPGINIGPWRLRNATNWQKEHGTPGQWRSGYTRLERGFYSVKSRLTLGESSTPADVFDTVPFEGVMLGTDDAMSAPGESTFSPVIRGIAQTQARVVVRQNGDTLYTRQVPPGPFALDNVPVPGSGGELEVSVEESNGDIQHFSVPWQTPAVALHEGYTRYSLMTGRYRMDGLPSVSVGQFTIMSGLPGSITLYGGVQQSDAFRSVAIGAGLSLGAAGSLSADVTRSAHHGSGGKAMRVRYSKSLNTTATQVSLELSRYSRGYRSLNESISYSEKDNPQDARENGFISLTQPLGRAGNLSFSASLYHTGQTDGNARNAVVSYSVALSGATLTLNWARNGLYRNKHWKTDRKLTMGVSIPLAQGHDGTTSAMLMASRSQSQGDTGQATLSGQSANGQFSWGATGSINRPHAPQPDSQATTLSAGWRGAYGRVTGHYGQNTWSRQVGAGVSGGLVMTRSGLVGGQSADGTLALINTPGAAGVRVRGRPGLRTSIFGQALMQATPYRRNRVSLDALSLGHDAELQQSEVQVVPTQGAVVPAVFDVRTGGRGLITLRLSSGNVVPFGAVVTQGNVDKSVAGIVGENGVAYLTGLGKAGELSVRWGRAATQQCHAPWRLPAEHDVTGLYHLTVLCR